MGARRNSLHVSSRFVGRLPRKPFVLHGRAVDESREDRGSLLQVVSLNPVEDVLARRTRALFLHVKASIQAAPLVARLLAKELGKSDAWEQDQLTQYNKLASQYIW